MMAETGEWADWIGDCGQLSDLPAISSLPEKWSRTANWNGDYLSGSLAALYARGALFFSHPPIIPSAF